MESINFFRIQQIAAVHHRMRIPPNYYTDFDFIKKQSQVQWEDPLKQGKEIKANDENFGWTDNGLFYNGQQVRLYIRDVMIYNGNIDRERLPRYHITWCETLEKMHQAGRYDKYVVSTSTNNAFLVNFVDGSKLVKSSYEDLPVCKNCLRKLDWKNYRQANQRIKAQIFASFSIEEFFETCEHGNEGNLAYLPSDTDLTAALNVYPNEWKVISKTLRSNKLKCNRCGKTYDINDKSKLHVHHKNGKKNDCRRSNLEVLCASCHQKEHPDHIILR